MLQSSVATGVISMRGTLVPLVLGVVSSTVQVGLFRVAQTPQTGLAAASSPARLVLMTEQTRDWERGERARIIAGLRALHEVGGRAHARRGSRVLHRDAVAHPDRLR